MIKQSEILRHAVSKTARESSRLIEEARRQGVQTAFLSHSSSDRELAGRIQTFLASNGWEMYVDWQDTSMPEKPSRDTAAIIKRRIKQHDWFIYLATANSSKSRWCPWEIGYADGVKDIKQIVIFPTMDEYGNYGSEYLNLYRRIGHNLLREDVGLIGAGQEFISLRSIY